MISDKFTKNFNICTHERFLTNSQRRYTGLGLLSLHKLAARLEKQEGIQNIFLQAIPVVAFENFEH